MVIAFKMKAENFFGSKKDLMYILEKLGVKDSKCCTNFEQPMVYVPGVGQVTAKKVYLDGYIAKCAEGIVDIKSINENEIVSNINWYEAVLLAEALGLQLLSNKDYWDCLRWAMTNDVKFLEELEFPSTWTGTLVVWHQAREELFYLLEQHNYNGDLPVIVENVKVIKVGDSYQFEGGNLVIPDIPIWEHFNGKFSFLHLEKKTGLPFKLVENGNFSYLISTAFVNNGTEESLAVTNWNILCGNETMFADRNAFYKSSHVGFFCKIPE